MTDRPVTFLLPSQTATGIYADRRSMAPDTGNEGNLHQWRLIYTLAGRCRSRTKQEDFTVRRGDMYLTDARVAMSLQVCGSAMDEDWDVAYAVFHPRPHWHVWLDALKFRDGLARVSFEGEVRDAVEKAVLNLVHVYQTENLLRDEQAMLALESLLLKIYAHAAHRQSVPNLWVRAALEYIHCNYHRRLTGPEIAHAAGISVSQMTTLFGEVMGASPGQYLERVRLAHAADMLRFSVSNVVEIARATGYGDANYFARRFRLHYGQAPGEYRHSNRPV